MNATLIVISLILPLTACAAYLYVRRTRKYYAEQNPLAGDPEVMSLPITLCSALTVIESIMHFHAEHVRLSHSTKDFVRYLREFPPDDHFIMLSMERDDMIRAALTLKMYDLDEIIQVVGSRRHPLAIYVSWLLSRDYFYRAGLKRFHRFEFMDQEALMLSAMAEDGPIPRMWDASVTCICSPNRSS